MPAWDRYLTERDRAVFARSGHGRRAGLGERLALLVVDATYAFVGDRPEPILRSLERWPQSAGEDGWRAVANIKALLGATRAAGVPIVYTTGSDGAAGSTWSLKNSRRAELTQPERHTIVPEIAPCPGDLIFHKEKPSAFFGTPLAAHLIRLGVDSLLVTGGTTSGCVRATVVDAFSYNYRVALVEECLFDRGEASHAMNLFDMEQKYADVIPLADAIAAVGRAPRAATPA